MLLWSKQDSGYPHRLIKARNYWVRTVVPDTKLDVVFSLRHPALCELMDFARGSRGSDDGLTLIKG